MKSSKLAKLGDKVDRAFAHRDDLDAVARETGEKSDHAKMLRQDAEAARLLDKYNAAVRRER